MNRFGKRRLPVQHTRGNQKCSSSNLLSSAHSIIMVIMTIDRRRRHHHHRRQGYIKAKNPVDAG